MAAILSRGRWVISTTVLISVGWGMQQDLYVTHFASVSDENSWAYSNFSNKFIIKTYFGPFPRIQYGSLIHGNRLIILNLSQKFIPYDIFVSCVRHRVFYVFIGVGLCVFWFFMIIILLKTYQRIQCGYDSSCGSHNAIADPTQPFCITCTHSGTMMSPSSGCDLWFG